MYIGIRSFNHLDGMSDRGMVRTRSKTAGYTERRPPNAENSRDGHLWVRYADIFKMSGMVGHTIDILMRIHLLFNYL